MSEDSPPSKEVQDRYITAGFADLDVSGKRADDWYCLLRNVQGAACLPRILDGSLKHLVDAADFESDALFCEWTYFIDWEKKGVKVHGGRGKGDRVCSFANLSKEWMESCEKSDSDGDDDEDEDAV